MTKEEFLNNLYIFLPPDGGLDPATDLTDEMFKVIEHVYKFHPSISDADGKRHIAYLYVNFGWALICDMKPRADLMEEKEREYAKAKSKLDEIKEDMEFLRKGGMPL